MGQKDTTTRDDMLSCVAGTFPEDDVMLPAQRDRNGFTLFEQEIAPLTCSVTWCVTGPGRYPVPHRSSA